MLDEQGVARLFSQIHSNWVVPEVERRRNEGGLSDDFRVRRCLVKFPIGKPAIVEFNDEIIWTAEVKLPAPATFEKHDPIYLSQIERVESVNPPTVDGERVGFIFVYSTGASWKIVFESSPAVSGQSDDDSTWELGKAIAESINLELKERVVGIHDAMQDDIRRIGLWPAPALLPYPLSAITDHCRKGELEAARRVLVEYCKSDFLQSLVESWDSLPTFAGRKQLFQDAIAAHRDGRFTLSISALVPQIEGVITDWLYSLNAAGAIPWRQESKTKKLRELLQGNASQSAVDRRIVEAAMDFILGGPVLATFADWLNPILEQFPNRNIVGHGKYDASIFSCENSLKVFLLLDTLFQVLVKHKDQSPAAGD